MTLWELQAASKHRFPATGSSPHIYRQIVFHKIIYLYGDILREAMKDRNKESEKYIKDIWLLILSGYLRLLELEGVMWHPKMYVKGYTVANCFTKCEVVAGVQMMHMMNGCRDKNKILCGINHALWMGHKIGIDFTFSDIKH